MIEYSKIIVGPAYNPANPMIRSGLYDVMGYAETTIGEELVKEFFSIRFNSFEDAMKFASSLGVSVLSFK